jgi:hypothetical protein
VAGERHERPAERRHVVQALGIEQRLVVARGQEEAAPRRLVRVLDQVEDPARRLLLEPLARVARVNSRGLGQLARRQRPAVGQGPVEAELVAEIDDRRSSASTPP